MEVWVALFEGARKYSPWNWRFERVNECVYIDAAVGHLLSYRAGESTDPDSGLSHITKAIAGLLILRDAQMHGSSIDDRLILQDLPTAAMADMAVALTERYEQASGPIDNVTAPTYGVRDEPTATIADHVTPVSGGPRVFTADDVGALVCFSNGDVGTITEWDEDDEQLPLRVDYVSADGENCTEWYTAEGWYDGYDGREHPLNITSIESIDTPPTVEVSLIAGGGSRALTKEDIGKTVILRNGERTVLNNANGPSVWAFQYHCDDEDNDRCEQSCTCLGWNASNADARSFDPDEDQQGEDVVAIVEPQDAITQDLPILDSDVGSDVWFVQDDEENRYDCGTIVDWDAKDPTNLKVKVDFGYGDYQWYTPQGVKDPACHDNDYPQRIGGVER